MMRSLENWIGHDQVWSCVSCLSCPSYHTLYDWVWYRLGIVVSLVCGRSEEDFFVSVPRNHSSADGSDECPSFWVKIFDTASDRRSLALPLVIIIITDTIENIILFLALPTRRLLQETWGRTVLKTWEGNVTVSKQQRSAPLRTVWMVSIRPRHGIYSKILTSKSQVSVFFRTCDPISTHSRSSHAYAERISSIGSEDDNNSGGGGAECEAYYSGSNKSYMDCDNT
jgi:hypothetical protein